MGPSVPVRPNVAYFGVRKRRGVELDRRVELVVEHEERCDLFHVSGFPCEGDVRVRPTLSGICWVASTGAIKFFLRSLEGQDGGHCLACRPRPIVGKRHAVGALPLTAHARARK